MRSSGRSPRKSAKTASPATPTTSSSLPNMSGCRTRGSPSIVRAKSSRPASLKATASPGHSSSSAQISSEDESSKTRGSARLSLGSTSVLPSKKKRKRVWRESDPEQDCTSQKLPRRSCKESLEAKTFADSLVGVGSDGKVGDQNSLSKLDEENRTIVYYTPLSRRRTRLRKVEGAENEARFSSDTANTTAGSDSDTSTLSEMTPCRATRASRAAELARKESNLNIENVKKPDSRPSPVLTSVGAEHEDIKSSSVIQQSPAQVRIAYVCDITVR